MTLDYAVPAYFHPLVAPEKWAALAESGAALRFVVVNVHNGAGLDTDTSYVAVVRQLRSRGIRMLGYIDTAYGNKSPHDVAAEHLAYVRRYRITGVFLDQTASGPDRLDHYRRIVRLLRNVGAGFVAINPGTYPAPSYLDLADVTVCFEGTWADYRCISVPGWVTAEHRSRTCHLVYDVPTEVAAPEDASAGHAVQTVCFTRGRQPNPWDRLPDGLE